MRDRNAKRQNRRLPKADAKKVPSFKRVFSFFKVLSITALVAGGIAVCGYFGNEVVSQFLSRPIASVSVEGDFNYLLEEEISELVSENIQQSFIRENLVKMNEKMESHPWVDRVTLRRQWPDRLLVTIEEQRPIARWSNTGFVNYRGELIFIEDNSLIKDLPELEGDPKSALSIMNQFQLLAPIFTEQQLVIKRLSQDQLGLWRVELDNQWQILLGRTDITKKAQRLMQLVATGKIERQQAIEAIDMRYNNGLAVRWKETTEAEQKLSAQPYKNHEKKI